MITKFKRIVDGIDFLNDTIGRGIAWLTLLMVVVTCGVVIARYLMGINSIALQESVMYMHGCVFMLGIAFTLKEKAHVRVDVLYERYSDQVRALIDMLGTILFLIPVNAFIFWISLEYVNFSWSLSESSAQPGGLPAVYLLKTLIPVMAGLVTLQGIAEFLKAFFKFHKKDT